MLAPSTLDPSDAQCCDGLRSSSSAGSTTTAGTSSHGDLGTAEGADGITEQMASTAVEGDAHDATEALADRAIAAAFDGTGPCLGGAESSEPIASGPSAAAFGGEAREPTVDELQQQLSLFYAKYDTIKMSYAREMLESYGLPQLSQQLMQEYGAVPAGWPLNEALSDADDDPVDVDIVGGDETPISAVLHEASSPSSPMSPEGLSRIMPGDHLPLGAIDQQERPFSQASDASASAVERLASGRLPVEAFAPPVGDDSLAIAATIADETPPPLADDNTPTVLASAALDSVMEPSTSGGVAPPSATGDAQIEAVESASAGDARDDNANASYLASMVQPMHAVEGWASNVLRTLAKTQAEQGKAPKRLSPVSLARAFGYQDMPGQEYFGGASGSQRASSAGRLPSSCGSPASSYCLRSGRIAQSPLQKVPSLPSVLPSCPAAGLRLSPSSAISPGRADAQRSAAQNCRRAVPGLDFERVKMDYDNDEDTEDEEAFLRSCLKPGSRPNSGGGRQEVPQLNMLAAMAAQRSSDGASSGSGAFLTPASGYRASGIFSPLAPRRGESPPGRSRPGKPEVTSSPWPPCAASPPKPPSKPPSSGFPLAASWRMSALAADRPDYGTTKAIASGATVVGDRRFSASGLDGMPLGKMRLPPVGRTGSLSKATVEKRGKATVLTHVHTHHHLHHHVVRPNLPTSVSADPAVAND